MGNRASRLGGLCPAHPPPGLCPAAHTPLPGPGCCHSCSDLSSGSSHYIPCGPSPPLLWGFGFIHPSLLAPSQQLAASWQGLGRRPAPSALPRQSGTTLASPQGPSSCAPLALPPHQPWLHRCCVDPNTVLCMGRADLPSFEFSAGSLPTRTWGAPDLIPCPTNVRPPYTNTVC